jgi:hypothetical protein
MRELMGYQRIARRCTRLRRLSQNDVVSYGIGKGANCLRGLRCFRTGMQLHLPKIIPKPRLEEGAGSGVERLAGGAEHLVHDGRRLTASGIRSSGWLHLQLLLFFRLAGGAFATKPRWRRCDGNVAVRHPHHLVRYSVGFLLIGIAWLIDDELWLNGRPGALQFTQHCPIAIGALQAHELWLSP